MRADGRGRAFLFFLLFPVLLAAPGCGRGTAIPRPPADGASRFPTGELLEEGDILLARSYGLVGAMFANHSVPEGEARGRYSHGSMIYRDGDGRLMVLNYRPTGMETCTPEEFFTRYNRLALVRFSGDLDAARPSPGTGLPPSLRGKDALSASARRWLAKNAEKRIPPDYRLDHDDQGAMFCLELPSSVYRECGLPDPFDKAVRADSDPLLIKANELFKADVIEIRSPGSVLSNPGFRTVSEWLRPEYDLRDEALNEALIDEVAGDIASGMMPRDPNFWGKLKIAQILGVYRIVTTLMFWRPKQDLPDFIDKRVIYNAYTLYYCVKTAKNRARERMARETVPVPAGGPPDGDTLDRVRRIAAEAFDQSRRRYLYMPD